MWRKPGEREDSSLRRARTDGAYMINLFAEMNMNMKRLKTQPQREIQTHIAALFNQTEILFAASFLTHFPTFPNTFLLAKFRKLGISTTNENTVGV